MDIARGRTFAILEAEGIVMGPLILGLVALALGSLVWLAGAEEWSRAKISRLSDSGFAVVETSPEGRKVRHLPHHDETGAVDLAHLKAARARLGQVKWLDPANEEVARRHLEEHWRQILKERSLGPDPERGAELLEERDRR